MNANSMPNGRHGRASVCRNHGKCVKLPYVRAIQRHDRYFVGTRCISDGSDLPPDIFFVFFALGWESTFHSRYLTHGAARRSPDGRAVTPVATASRGRAGLRVKGPARRTCRPAWSVVLRCCDNCFMRPGVWILPLSAWPRHVSG